MTSDFGVPSEANGLQSTILPCNRLQFVYEVVRGHGIERWLDSQWRTPEAIATLEGPDQQPDLWWVSRHPVRLRLVLVQGRIR